MNTAAEPCVSVEQNWLNSNFFGNLLQSSIRYLVFFLLKKQTHMERERNERLSRLFLELELVKFEFQLKIEFSKFQF